MSVNFFFPLIKNRKGVFLKGKCEEIKHESLFIVHLEKEKKKEGEKEVF